MKKYKLDIRIRKDLEERPFETIELDLSHFTEAFYIKELSVFDKSAYFVFYLEEIKEEGD